ncbi:hypothetical protein L2Y94_13085 [Luteibacter aegosomatis]|uniref:hypothetical protein n=1 Tax=Luteibacter aegosomatis TaxID=2911537 RepID=UPI001FF73611|nr:hypothetical protein [Luteibacter aegosomatis]UPG84278.1 hypothetical protein L2Y94_13085 [Luteibacter aegosomatis]
MKKLLIMGIVAFQAQAFASTPAQVAGTIEDFENVAVQPPALSLDLPGMTIDSYYNGNVDAQRPMLAVESDSASSMKGHHLVVRTEYQPISNWHDGGFWLRPKVAANGIRFRMEVNQQKAQRMTLSCDSNQAGGDFEFVNVWLPDHGEVSAYCPASMHLSFIQFFTVGEGLAFRFDDIELR